MRAFELHTCSNGVWKLDSVFDGRALAIHEARRADDTDRYAAILVVEENRYVATDKVDRRVIARTSRADREDRARRAATAGKPVPIRPAAGKSSAPAKRPKAPAQRSEEPT